MVFYHALYWSFWGVVVVAVLAVISTWLIPVSGKSAPVKGDELGAAVAK
jgi:hypothetical protein